MINTKATSLPAYAGKYLRTVRGDAPPTVVRLFHQWCERRKLTVQNFQIHHINEFLAKPGNNSLAVTTQQVYRSCLLQYLRFLHSKKLLSFIPPRPLAKPRYFSCYADRFLGEIKVTLKYKTVALYKSNLRAFHDYLDRSEITLADLDRHHMVEWFRCKEHAHLSPATMHRRLCVVRVYLRWLYEYEIITAPPDDLIRVSDFPKLPQYLPRPLPPKTDFELQQFLEAHDSLWAKGLLLMRRTGMRIGELQSLPYDCVHTDFHGNAFLKVPLGKLNNERLVPLERKTVDLIHTIQASAPSPRAFLISTTKTKKADRRHFRHELRKAKTALQLTTPIFPHQLRHSAATELLNAGMTLTSVMRFLGHKDFRMTLRYAQITQETVLREFQQAIAESEKRYFMPATETQWGSIEPEALITNLVKWVQKHTCPNSRQHARLIIKRLRRLQAQLLAFDIHR